MRSARSLLDVALLTLAAGVCATLSWEAGERPSRPVMAAVAGALAAGAALVPGRRALPASLFTALCALALLDDGKLLPWPACFAVPLVVTALLLVAVPALRPLRPALRRGEVRGAPLALALGVVAVSSLALVLWRLLMAPDLGQLERMIPHRPLPVLLAGGLGFALFNALLEEGMFRVLFLDGLLAATSAPLAVAVQGLSFGLLHLHGFPRGAFGVLLATVYGLMLGGLRVRAGGMLLVYLAHVAADVTIFSILLAWTR